MQAPVGDLSALGGMKNIYSLTLRAVEGATKLDVVKDLTALTELIMVKVNTKGGEAVPLEAIKTLPKLKTFIMTKDAFTKEQLTGFASPAARFGTE